MKTIKISDFINTKYKEYWVESSQNRNVCYPYEGLMTIERRIIWAAYKIGMFKLGEEHKTIALGGETLKYHIAGDQSVYDSIKGIATDYKRQPAVRILKGVGNMGSCPGDPGAAARYTSVAPTPLLISMLSDIKYLPLVTDETGLEQPYYVSSPLPMLLINGMQSIGIGKAAYYDERDAKEVINWIDKLIKEDKTLPAPAPISTSNCDIWVDKTNGYTYYKAKIHTEGKFDIITSLPPRVSAQSVITNLKKKLPKIAKLIKDGSGKGKPVYIIVPTGYIEDKDLHKYNLLTARKEAYYIWDDKINTVRLCKDLNEIALSWVEKRKEVVTARLEDDIAKSNDQIHKIDLIKLYVEKEMNKWKSEDIEKELGKEDADIVLKQPARTFLPENIGKNEITRKKLLQQIKEDNTKIKDVYNVIIQEAYDIIDKQEKFFAE